MTSSGPLRPSPRQPHREWWAPLLRSCADLQRANDVSGPLLSPIDLTGERARLRALWKGGPDITLAPDPESGTEQLLSLLRRSAPMAETAPVIPDGGSVWWAPKADAPPRRRYAWLLDQLGAVTLEE